MKRTFTRPVSLLLVVLGVGIAASFLLLPAQETQAVDGECTTITGGGVTGVLTATSTEDCMWSDMECRDAAATAVHQACSPDKVCSSSIQFLSCSYSGGIYTSQCKAYYECGTFW